MNFSDSEIVASVLTSSNMLIASTVEESDLILVNTCSIRDHAEQRVLSRIKELQALRKSKPNLRIGVIGCMAERMQEKLFEGIGGVDLLAGPDSYRELPSMLENLEKLPKAINVLLSEEETYADISPIRYDSNGVSAFISIMRGCRNFCSYCVVPYTRGNERSRDPNSIFEESNRLFSDGYREITLLGQNVNSYLWNDAGGSMTFPDLLAMIAGIDPKLRIRFATSHPKDLSDELLKVMSSFPNICRSIHLPVQSGSDEVLKRMNRKYTAAWYLDRIAAIRRYLPDAAISTDIIAGFCSETDEDHACTLNIMRKTKYSHAFMFKYSMRPGTYAAENLEDNVPEPIKSKRLQEIIALQQQLSLESNQNDIGSIVEVLVEGVSKKSQQEMFGRTSSNKVVVFKSSMHRPGDYTMVLIEKCTSATLIGKLV